MSALSKATGISANPRPNVLDQEPIDPSLMMRGEMPLTPGQIDPILRSLGKPLSQLLGMILKPVQSGTGVPSRLRYTNYDAPKGLAQFHSVDRAGQAFEASPKDLDALLKGGAIDVEQPPQGAVEKIRKLLAAAMGERP